MVDPHSRRPTYNHQENLNAPRTIIAHRPRLAQDYPFFDSLVRLFRPKAQQDFILIAESTGVKTPYFSDGQFEQADDQHGALCGVIAVLPIDADKTVERYRKDFLSEIDGFISTQISDKTSNVPAQTRPAIELYDRLQVVKNSVACFFMRFAVFRTGELRIWFDLNLFLGRDVRHDAASLDELEVAAHLPAQAYYFIKDLLHAHYHHDPHSDQILPLTRLETGHSSAAIQEDEARWRYVTLRGLARVVVELRQSRSFQSHKRALGVIAYAKAFQSVLARTCRHEQLADGLFLSNDLILYDFENLQMSIDANNSAAESSSSARLQLFGIEVGIFLSALALWAGAVQIHPILCGALGRQVTCPKIKPGPVITIVNLIVANPIPFCVLLVVLGFAIFVAIFRKTGAIPHAERLIRWLSRFSEALGAQISRWTQNSDILGYLIALSTLGSLLGTLGYAAYRITPKTPVPAIVPPRDTKVLGAWGSLIDLSGQRIDQSGLLARSIVSSDIRNLLGQDYQEFLRLLDPQTTLVRHESELVAASSREGDGAYIIVDTEGEKIEAGIKQDGKLRMFRTPGHPVSRPSEIETMLGGAQRSDAEPVPMQISRACQMYQSGPGGRTLQLKGALRKDDHPCEFNVSLQKGQVLSFNSKTGRGLGLMLDFGSYQVSLDQPFPSPKTGTYHIRLAWAGWHPHGNEGLTPRPFFARLDIQ